MFEYMETRKEFHAQIKFIIPSNTSNNKPIDYTDNVLMKMGKIIEITSVIIVT